MPYQEADWGRYETARNWRTRPRHPTPSKAWQTDEYVSVMERYPPKERDDWQFSYNPRSKKSRERFKEFINGT
jgi:hypothetical protein